MANSAPQSTVRPAGWAIHHLVNAGGDRRLRLGIPDTVLLNDGAAEAWLFTSKAGEVLKKRVIRATAIQDRFSRLANTNPNNPQRRAAILRFSDGTVQYLGHAKFKELMQKFPPTEPGILAMQCYIQSKGSGGTVYRNSYSVVNDKGLIVTFTGTFATLPPVADPADAPVVAWSARDARPVKSNAAKINAALNSVTSSLVRFVEAGQRAACRVLHLECDYAIDEAGQIWLLWAGEATVATGDAARDLRLADVREEGLYGRGSFLGRETSLVMQREVGGAPAPQRPLRRLPGGGAGAGGPLRRTGTQPPEETSRFIERAAEAVELSPGVKGGGGGGIVGAEAAVAAAVVAKELGGSTSFSEASRRAEGGSGAPPPSTMTVGVRTSETLAVDARGRAPGGKHYPSAFACSGDYCVVRVLVRSGGNAIVYDDIVEKLQ